MATTLVAHLRAELQNKINVPKSFRSKLKPSALCCWLSELQSVLTEILVESKSYFDLQFSEVVDLQLLSGGSRYESHVILQINLLIRQLFPEIFVLALTAHARLAFKRWLRYPKSSRSCSFIEEFQLCKKFGWSDIYSQKYINMLHEAIEEKVENLCKGEYQTEFLPELRQYVDVTILPFALNIFSRDLTSEKSANLLVEKDSESKLRDLLQHSLLHALSKSRAKELFEIVADFPDSIMAIKELKEAANGSANIPHIGVKSTYPIKNYST
jgi:hypothetical protein